MLSHEDAPFKVQEVGPPDDLSSTVDDSGIVEFRGTCPVCKADAGPLVLPTVRPGTIAKGLPWKRDKGAVPVRRRMECRCAGTHPNTLEEEGCGAWWTVRIPVAGR